LTAQIVKEQNWQPMIDETWNTRLPDDYNRGQNTDKRDFMRSWEHSRTMKRISLDEISETGVKMDGEMLYDIADARAAFESKVITEVQMDQFKSRLTDQDKQILQMRYDGCSLKEIAEKVGFKTPSAVCKHIESIAGQYDDFVGGEYSEFLDKHTK
jgi:DNA-directed RNA polymerase specialized sigma subunit